MGIINFTFHGRVGRYSEGGTLQIKESCLEKIFDAERENVEIALADLASELSKEFAASAKYVGSNALGKKSLYVANNTLYKRFHGGTKASPIGSVKIKYYQSRLNPKVGTDTVRWRHTSPIGDNPKDYSELVNSGNSGDLKYFRNRKKPSWINTHYKDDVQERLGDIVSDVFSIYGIRHT